MSNFSDNFTRANSNTTLGSFWSALSGVFGINSNQAYLISGAGPAVVDAGLSDCRVAMTMQAFSASGMAVRATDANNFIRIRPLDNGFCFLETVIAGSVTTILFVADTAAAGDVYTVLLQGPRIQVSKNGNTLITWSGTFNQSATKHGLFGNSGDTTTRWSAFSISAIPVPAPLTAPTDLPGCALWLSSSVGVFKDAAGLFPATTQGDGIALWRDQSGNGNDATQTTPANQPSLKLNAGYGRQAVSLNGTSSFLSLGTPAALATAMAGDFTLYVRLVPRQSGNDVIFTRSTSGNGLRISLMLANSVTSVQQLNAPGAASRDAVATTWYRYGTRYLREAAIHKLRGALFSSDSTFDLIGTSSPFLIGQYDGQLGGYWGSSDILDVIVYGRAITDNEIAALGAWFRTQGNQRASFPSLLTIDGNSITWGQAADPGLGWAQVLKRSLGIPDSALFDCGIPGQTTASMATNQAAKTSPIPAQFPSLRNVLIAQELINHVNQGATAQQAHDSYMAYCQAARAAGFKVVAMTWTAAATWVNQTTMAACNALIRADVASWSDAFFDAAADTFLGNPPNSTYFADGVHLTDVGHAYLAAQLKPITKPLLVLPTIVTVGLGIGALALDLALD